MTIVVYYRNPILIRSVFLNAVSLSDDLQLVERLEIAFREEKSKGKDADYIYVDVNDYPGAVSLGGLYHTEDDKIANLQVRLFGGDKDPIDLKIRASDNVKFLIRSIVKEMKEVLAGY